ncbi:hypothetical protein RHMOL_Rhmol08G0253600 [Rhododendron molle]|uniref:Uncharacterized protein n=1 Tax=Rhododendron molle TaxID=49168 RepID=A0ACC0MTA6_RHOML|nr:hypothetical protein RHMOL_Rhmol08G0253600 [Rhododendron molle]
MVSMTSLWGGVHTISINNRKGNVHHLLRKMNKIALITMMSPCIVGFSKWD